MKNKNLIIACMIVTMSLLLVACQSEREPADSTTTNKNQGSVELAETTESPETTENSDSEETTDQAVENETTAESESTDTIEKPGATNEPESTGTTEKPGTTNESESTEKTEESTSTNKPHVHSYKEKVTAPTCTEGGYTTFTCDCGHTYKGKKTEALGHSFTKFVYDNNAELGKHGTETAYCDNAGCDKYVWNIVDGTSLEPTWTECNKIMYVNPSTVNKLYVMDRWHDGTEIGSIKKGEAVTVTGTCDEWHMWRINWNGKDAYVHRRLSETKPEVETETETTNPNDGSGYDEFGNKYTLNSFGERVFNVECPYQIDVIFEINDKEVCVYGIVGQPGKILDAQGILIDRYGKGVIFDESRGEVVSWFETESTVSWYNGVKIHKATIRYIGP
ncbi:MAG: hypothetical protein E7266_07900 [Lachnospiraceae bacterium]|nr:hypothetical protein [Lachnospiraceae bacterium]